MEKTDSISARNDAIRSAQDEGLMGVAAKIRPVERSIVTGRTSHPTQLLPMKPIYKTQLGAA